MSIRYISWCILPTFSVDLQTPTRARRRCDESRAAECKLSRAVLMPSWSATGGPALASLKHWRVLQLFASFHKTDVVSSLALLRSDWRPIPRYGFSVRKPEPEACLLSSSLRQNEAR